jgi:carboxymethylenebutenolidase
MNEQLHPQLQSLLPKSELTRRGFVVTSLATGFALAAGPVQASVIRTDAKGLVAGEVKIPTSDGQIPGYRAMPAKGGPFATVLVVHEVFGVHEHIKDICRRLAKAGYFAVAPELFARQGDASKYTMANAGKLFTEVVLKKTDAETVSDLDATVAWAKSAPQADVTRLGITGFCWGGRATLVYATQNPNLKAAVAWYGHINRAMSPSHPIIPLAHAAQIKAALLGLYGAQDGGIPVSDVHALEAALKAAGNTKSRFVVYPNAGHAFFADYRHSYREGPAKDGWRRMLAWFKAHGLK